MAQEGKLKDIVQHSVADAGNLAQLSATQVLDVRKFILKRISKMYSHLPSMIDLIIRLLDL